MWKNSVLQYRRPVQTFLEILAPVLLSGLLVYIRSKVIPRLENEKIYSPFCTFPIALNFKTASGEFLCPSIDNIPSLPNSPTSILEILGKSPIPIIYSPSNSSFDTAMEFFKTVFQNVIGLQNSQKLQKFAINMNTTCIGIEFPDKYGGILDWTNVQDLSITIRFPPDINFHMDDVAQTWMTDLVYPILQTAGPRSPQHDTGASPSYYKEQFLFLQHLLATSIILAKNKVTNINDAITWLQNKQFPWIQIRRFPYAPWYSDDLLSTIENLLIMIILFSFGFSFINTVKDITMEKEKQLKESMKIMGLPNWLHWTAWFIKCFIYLSISVGVMVALLKIKFFGSDFTVFTYASTTVLFVFFVLYVISAITFSFAFSVFFSKANTAAFVASIFWFASYGPFMYMQNNYAGLSLTTKMFSSLATNTAIALGIKVICMYEGSGEGIAWNNLFTPNTPDDNLTLGHIWIMLIINSILYLFIALYVESVFPGEYGVPQKWYYLFTKSYWCGETRIIEDADSSESPNRGEFFEPEPKGLKAGIKIYKLKKVFGNKTAVQNVSLNMYEDHITVLLGHNGAGKTTTMSMWTGMIPPTSGSAKINGYDIKTEMSTIRNSLGLCPQHNIIFDDLTVAEHLYFFCKLKGLTKNETRDEIDNYIKLLGLEEKRNARSSTLSGGMKRKLSVGIALCGKSKVIMLDEPTSGMDPSARRVLWHLLQKQKEGRTMLLTTHFMDEADLLGDRIAIMAGGEIKCSGSSFFLKKKYGAGYILVIEKTRECNPQKVTEMLQKFIPDIEIHSNVGSELTYQLTENRAAVFEDLLKQLESQTKSLGILSFGIALTTLEEVFMKVGTDHGQEEEYNEGDNNNNINNNASISLGPEYTGGPKLMLNQFMAMLFKKILSSVRSWILLIIQICIPMIQVILVLNVPNFSTTGLPPMPLNLGRFENPVTLVDPGLNTFAYHNHYKNVLKGYGLSATDDQNITDTMLTLTRTNANRVRRLYIVGASFGELSLSEIEIPNVKLPHITLPKITAWFNNDPYHSPGISLGFVLSAVYKKLTGCPNCNLEFINKPLPNRAQTQLENIHSHAGMNQDFILAFQICLGMAFVSSMYIVFPIRENVSKSKHLQFVSGVKVYIYWLGHAIWDMITYSLTVIVLIITLVCFQKDGLTTAEQLGIFCLALAYFGWAFMPLVYLASFYFDVPSNGFDRFTLISLFTGSITFMAVTILSLPTLDLTDVADGLHWAFLWFPHYALASGINNYFTKYQRYNACDNYYKPLLEECETALSHDECVKMLADLAEMCEGADRNYLAWESPGMGKNIFFSLLSGVIFFVILLIVEYKLLVRVVYFLDQKIHPRYPVDQDDEDDDVAKEKNLIRNATEADLQSGYTLVVRDLTKYYKKMLAVNGLSMGIGKYECFGLLGVNGAGKTTTFKMMSGDERISYGDGWVSGKSIKRQLKKVQRNIGYCPQFDALLDDMTAKETIIMYCLLRGIALKRTYKVADHLSKEFDFHRHLNKKVKELSGGNKRKLSTVLSLIGDPPVLFLDEPTTGMDPATKRYVWDSLCKLRDSGKTIVLTSHSMEECEALCTRLAIMVNGNFKCLGSTQHLKNKFTEGYVLTIKVRKLPESSGEQYSDTEQIEKFIRENFPGAHLKERHQELLNYYIVDKSKPWSTMFGILERGKKRSELNIEDYSLRQNSLEQVFLTFAKHQVKDDD